MGKKYYVMPMKQPTASMCFPTAIRMIDSYSQLTKGSVFRPTQLENNLSSPSFVRSFPLLTETQAIRLAEQWDFGWDFVPTTPEAFLAALQRRGPFAYIGDLPLDRPYKHTLVVTGVAKVHHRWMLDFNDPWQGKARSEEFYRVLADYVPTDTDAMNNIRIFYKK